MIKNLIFIILLPLLLVGEFITLPAYGVSIFVVISFLIYEKGSSIRSLFFVALSALLIDVWIGNFIGSTLIIFMFSYAVYASFKKLLPVAVINQYLSYLFAFSIYSILLNSITNYTNSGNLGSLDWQDLLGYILVAVIELLLLILATFVDTNLFQRAKNNIKMG